MSASLVGSEMCIRDRWLRSTRRVVPPTCAKHARRHAETARAMGCFSSACLLYTSDAADDM
eukprot:2590920-Alexandrium_andersonii.AAC.1